MQHKEKKLSNPLAGRVPTEVIVGVTGSIAAYKACDLVSGLRKLPANVTVVLTKEASKFVTPLTFQTLSGNPVTDDMFSLPEEWEPVHISIADRASLVVVAPATANLIGKIANGICDDLLTCVLLSTKSPILICPAMNCNMYTNRLVQDNISKLKRLGYHFLGPVKGHLACGYEGMGRLVDVEQIIDEAKRFLRKS